jgi:hypothetical protein
MIPYAPNISVILCLNKHIEHTFCLDQGWKLKQVNLAMLNGLFRSHLKKLLIVLRLLSGGTEDINRTDVVTLLLAVLLNCSPTFGNLIVTMKSAKIPTIRLKVNLPGILKEGMKMRGTILVKLRSYHPLFKLTCSFEKL